MKYFNYNFEWIEISLKTIENFAKGKKSNNENNKKGKKN
jgi:hypothetical protein